jgi:uncharacterized protein involved in outer membrane biogenesis
MKWMGRLVVLVVALLAAVILLADRIVARALPRWVQEQTGFGMTMDDLSIRFTRPEVRIRNLVLTNPPEFPDPEALTVREARVRYNLLSLFGEEIRLYDVRLDIPRVVMVRTPSGSNVEALSRGGNKPAETGSPAPEGGGTGTGSGGGKEPVAKKPPMKIRIDSMNVKFGEMEVRTFRSEGGEPAVLNVPVGLDRSFSNVTNVEQVAIQLTSELVLRSGVGLLRQLDPAAKKLNENAKSAETSIKKALEDLGLRKKKTP